VIHLIKVLSKSPEETTEIGRMLGGILTGGDLVALTGTLGAGKSVIARGILRALGVVGDIPSPSFVLVAQYEGSVTDSLLKVNHIDFYRLGSKDEALGLGLEDLLGGDSVSVMEWADRVDGLLPGARYDVALEPGRETCDRLVTIRSADPVLRKRLAAVAKQLKGFGL
jgi:tRNA threonylcarbamoyladenosine biosynthesis protein TsaE